MIHTTALRRTRYPGKIDSRVLSAIAPDPHFSSVVFLCHFDGANNSTVFTDVKSKIITPVSNAKISTTQSKFGGSSGYFDGNGSSKISIANNADFAFGSSDFTVEFWVYLNSGSPYLFGKGDAASAAGSSLVATNTTWVFYYNSSGTINIPCTVNPGTWTHLAGVRNGTTLRVFRDGVVTGTATLPAGATINTTSNPYQFGGYSNLVSLNGYLDELRSDILPTPTC